MNNTSVKVLLVEDDPIVQKVHSSFLKNFGYKHDLAENGVKALDLADKKKYNLILMDVGLPDHSGMYVIANIRGNFKNRSTPIVVLSAYQQNEIKEQCMAVGATDFFLKPINLQKLKDIVDKYSIISK